MLLLDVNVLVGAQRNDDSPHSRAMRAWLNTALAGHEAVARTALGLYPRVEKASDEPTADLLTQRLDVHEKTAWMLRSMLEE